LALSGQNASRGEISITFVVFACTGTVKPSHCEIEKAEALQKLKESGRNPVRDLRRK